MYNDWHALIITDLKPPSDKKSVRQKEQKQPDNILQHMKLQAIIKFPLLNFFKSLNYKNYLLCFDSQGLSEKTGREFAGTEQINSMNKDWTAVGVCK